MRRILTEPEHSLIKQYVALMETEGVTLDFTDDAIDALADLAADINDRVENIGARRLQTVLEQLLDEISFTATDRGGETRHVDAAYVHERVAPLADEGRSEPVHSVVARIADTTPSCSAKAEHLRLPYSTKARRGWHVGGRPAFACHDGMGLR